MSSKVQVAVRVRPLNRRGVWVLIVVNACV